MKYKLIIIILVITLAFYLGYKFFLKDLIETEKQLQDFCKEKNIDEVCNFYMLDCYRDCDELGLDYWRFDAGGWGISECYCKENINNKTEIKQVW